MLNQIAKIYKEYPDVDVIELKDGTFIGITEELICYYPSEVFSEEYICIERPDFRRRFDDHSTNKYYEINENHKIRSHNMICNTDYLVLKDGTELWIQPTKVTLILRDGVLTLDRNFCSPYYHILCLIQDVNIQGEQHV